MAIQVLTVCFLFTGAFGRYALPSPYANLIKPVNYVFGYGVKDLYSGTDHARQEAAFIDPYTGHNVVGRYQVLLPDGRLQVVTYKADESGYRADVNYEEVPYHQPPQIIKPYSSAHVYKHHQHLAPASHDPTILQHLPSHNLYRQPLHPAHHLPFKYAPNYLHGPPLPIDGTSHHHFPANTYHLSPTTEKPLDTSSMMPVVREDFITDKPIVMQEENVPVATTDDLITEEPVDKPEEEDPEDLLNDSDELIEAAIKNASEESDVAEENDSNEIIEAAIKNALEESDVAEENDSDEIIEAAIKNALEESDVPEEKDSGEMIEAVVAEVPENIPLEEESDTLTEAAEVSTDAPIAAPAVMKIY